MHPNSRLTIPTLSPPHLELFQLTARLLNSSVIRIKYCKPINFECRKTLGTSDRISSVAVSGWQVYPSVHPFELNSCVQRACRSCRTSCSSVGVHFPFPPPCMVLKLAFPFETWFTPSSTIEDYERNNRS